MGDRKKGDREYCLIRAEPEHGEVVAELLEVDVAGDEGGLVFDREGGREGVDVIKLVNVLSFGSAKGAFQGRVLNFDWQPENTRHHAQSLFFAVTT